MTVFKAEQTSLNGAVRTLSQNLVNVYSKISGAETLTTTQFVDGIVNQTAAQGAHNLTTPTAAAIVAAIRGCAVDTSFEFNLINTTGGATITVVGGTGVTIVGVATVLATNRRIFQAVVTNVGSGTETVTLYAGATSA